MLPKSIQDHLLLGITFVTKSVTVSTELKMGARTRRQQAALAAQSDSNESPAGNGTVENSPKKTRTSGKKEVKENVYLFAPNLIGKELLPVSSNLHDVANGRLPVAWD